MGGSSLLGESTDGLLFLVPPAFDGASDIETQVYRSEWKDFVDQLLVQKRYGAIKQREYLTIPIGSVTGLYLLKQRLIKIGRDEPIAYYYHHQLTNIETGAIMLQKWLPVSEISEWLPLFQQNLDQLVMKFPLLTPKDLYQNKKIEVSVVNNGTMFGALGILVLKKIQAALFDFVIVIDSLNYHDQMAILRLRGIPFTKPNASKVQRYQKSEHLHARIDFQLQRDPEQNLAITAIQGKVLIQYINMVNGQTIDAFDIPWLTIKDPNPAVETDENAGLPAPKGPKGPKGKETGKELAMSADTPAAEEAFDLNINFLDKIKDTLIGQELVKQLEQRTATFTAYKEPLKVAKVYGRWIYISGGRKRGYKIGHRLTIQSNKPEQSKKTEPVLAHVIRYFGPHLKLTHPDTGKVIDDGMIGYIRQGNERVQLGDVVQIDPTIYPMLPKNIKQFLEE